MAPSTLGQSRTQCFTMMPTIEFGQSRRPSELGTLLEPRNLSGLDSLRNATQATLRRHRCGTPKIALFADLPYPSVRNGLLASSLSILALRHESGTAATGLMIIVQCMADTLKSSIGLQLFTSSEKKAGSTSSTLWNGVESNSGGWHSPAPYKHTPGYRDEVGGFPYFWCAYFHIQTCRL